MVRPTFVSRIPHLLVIATAACNIAVWAQHLSDECLAWKDCEPGVVSCGRTWVRRGYCYDFIYKLMRVHGVNHPYGQIADDLIRCRVDGKSFEYEGMCGASTCMSAEGFGFVPSSRSGGSGGGEGEDGRGGTKTGPRAREEGDEKGEEDVVVVVDNERRTKTPNDYCGYDGGGHEDEEESAAAAAVGMVSTGMGWIVGFGLVAGMGGFGLM